MYNDVKRTHGKDGDINTQQQFWKMQSQPQRQNKKSKTIGKSWFEQFKYFTFQNFIVMFHRERVIEQEVNNLNADANELRPRHNVAAIADAQIKTINVTDDDGSDI